MANVINIKDKTIRKEKIAGWETDTDGPAKVFNLILTTGYRLEIDRCYPLREIGQDYDKEFKQHEEALEELLNRELGDDDV